MEDKEELINCEDSSNTFERIIPVPRHLAGKLNLRSYPFLHFLGGALSREKALELIEELSNNYFNVKESRHLSCIQDFMVTPADLGLDICLHELSQSYLILEYSKIPLPEAPKRLVQEIDFLVANGIFQHLSGEAQTYIFKNISLENKNRIVKNIICKLPCINEEEAIMAKRYITQISSINNRKWFKLNLAGIELIISNLAAQEEFYFPKDKLPRENDYYFSPVDLVDYLPKDQASRDLWLEYLKSDKPNRMYAAEVLAEMGDKRVIEYVLKLKEEPPPNPFEENLSKGQEYEERITKPIGFFLRKWGIKTKFK